MSKQTAVQWFKDVMYPYLDKESKEYVDILFNHALQMEREQMDIVAGDWWNEGASYMHDGKRKYESFEQYYNETYGGQDE